MVKKARNPSDDRNAAADLEQLIATLRFPLSTIHVAVDGSRFLGLLLCFPSGHCVQQETVSYEICHPAMQDVAKG